MKTSRREFLKRSGVGAAGLSVLPAKLIALDKPSTNLEKAIPPHKSMVVPGVHGYAEQSVAAGEQIQFRISSTVPYRLGIWRLGMDPDSTEKDVALNRFSESLALPQAIHPGSYVLVEKNLKGTIKALTLECWVRRW